MRFFRFRPSYFLTALLSLLLCYNLLTYFENSVANEVRDQIQNHNSKISMPTLYVITPTYSRKTQIADLVRLKQTLKLVPKCAWIVVEDANRTNPLVHRYIEDFPRLIYINEDSERREVDRGVAQRNRALVEIVKLKLDTNGALYFADDDNTYDAAFLNQIRWVKTVGVFNVGLIAGLPFEGPLVSEEGKVIGWKTGWNGDREFCIDMAGIVINLNFFLSRSRTFRPVLFQHTRKGPILFTYGILKLPNLRQKASSRLFRIILANPYITATLKVTKKEHT
ncbi:galactosylgalactosylxylosylprotein 3-beta-glucuronosyltransferase 1-like isoform X2 [Convolutriloba macropyga]|uniref:galactosylgalactosylxylosylprotein 3-beta-glucuronosyltransferase 1-like isoform X2 n=1 Tax=Convolutriloba macropyga TaxID=536237 RepID=UPI003F51C0C5